MNKKVIYLDAGHGGTDPGAIGKIDTKLGQYQAIKEKDITLNICKDIEKAVNKADLSFTIRLTRKIDYFVSLGERCRRANSSNADAFISIHCNARVLKGKWGIEVETFHYKNSQKGKTLAVKLLIAVLNAMEKHHEQVTFWGRIFPYFRPEPMRFLRRRIDTANFYVLRKTAMPAALVECGFLSDPEEARYLMQRKHQRIIAKGIIEGIKQYLI